MNWSLILNIILLVGVVIAIVRTLKIRRQEAQAIPRNPQVYPAQTPIIDEVIAVRKIGEMPQVNKPSLSPKSCDKPSISVISREELFVESAMPIAPVASSYSSNDERLESSPSLESESAEPVTLMMFLLAKSDRQFAGYELLQAVLSAGFRFGEGDLFHRHQFPNGQGPIMCSLAAATASGIFDLQNIGVFMVRGLCLFMQVSGNAITDAERFDTMMDTAKTLSDNLDAHLLDDKRQPLSELSITRYHERLTLQEFEESVC